MDIQALEKMITAGNDSALLRVTLSRACRDQERMDEALEHAQQAVKLDPDYSAAWQHLAELQTQMDRPREAMDTYDQGIECAERKGDAQLLKMMQVFRRRLARQMEEDSNGKPER